MPVEVFYETFDSALDNDGALEKQDLVLHQFRPAH
jgi:hypothetical protein